MSVCVCVSECLTAAGSTARRFSVSQDVPCQVQSTGPRGQDQCHAYRVAAECNIAQTDGSTQTDEINVTFGL